MTSKPNSDHSDVVKNEYFLPGHTVSTDEYECKFKGILPHTRRKEGHHKMYCGGIFHRSRVFQIRYVSPHWGRGVTIYSLFCYPSNNLFYGNILPYGGPQNTIW